jgi:hypothetical protein
MAYSNRVKAESFVASGDLSALQFHIVELVAAHVVDVALLRVGYGILQNKPQAGEHASVAVEGVSKCIAGVAVSVGDLITSAGSGWATSAASGIAGDKQVIGRALTAAASGSVFSVEIDRQMIVRTGGLPV